MSALRLCLVKREGGTDLLVTSTDKLQVVLVNCVFELGTEHSQDIRYLSGFIPNIWNVIVLQSMSLAFAREENNIEKKVLKSF